MRTWLRSKVTLLFLTCTVLMLIFPAMAFAQGAPTIQSDKADYAPGDLVTLTGSGWQPGESVHINVNDTYGATWTRNVDVIADPGGNITDSFNLPNSFVSDYDVTATGTQSGTVTTTFTDSNPNQVTVASPPSTSQTVNQGASATYGNVSVRYQGSAAACTVTLSVAAPQPASGGPNPQPADTPFPAGATANFGTSSLTGVSGQTLSSTFSVSTTNATPGGTYTFHVQAKRDPADTDCQGTDPTISVQQLTLTVNDITAPSVAITSPANNSSTTNSSINVSGTASDESGIQGVTVNGNAATFTYNSGSSTNGTWTRNNVSLSCGSNTITAVATDNSPQHKTGSTSITVTRTCDTTPPTVTATAVKGTAPNFTGATSYTAGTWTNQDVRVTFDCEDNVGGSGLTAGSADQVKTFTTETSGTTASFDGTCADNAGNTAAASNFGPIKIDKTNPTFSCPAADSDWHATNQTFNCTASGGDSGLNPTSDSSFSLSTNVAAGSETNNASTDTKTLTDGAGNTATAPAITGVKVDRKAPTFSCPTADSDWHGSNQTFTCSAADGGSGLNPTGDSSFSLSTSVTAGNETNNASTGTKTLTDAVGNTVTAPAISGNKVDKKAPAITLTKPANGDTYIAGEVVNANYSCSDGGSDTASCNGTVTNNTAIDTSFGSHTFKVDATDQVGNTSSLTHNYGVSYSFNGWLQPVDGDGTATGAVNMGKVGRTYPIKWQVREYVNGVLQPISDTAAQNLVSSMTGKAKSVTCGSWATLGSDLLEDYTTGNTTLRYDATSDQFIYNYKAPSSPVCQAFVISKADGVNDKQANFQFTK